MRRNLVRAVRLTLQTEEDEALRTAATGATKAIWEFWVRMERMNWSAVSGAGEWKQGGECELIT